MGYQNKRGVSMDEDTWQDFIALQELTGGKSKAELLREMLKRELSNLRNSRTSNSKDLK